MPYACNLAAAVFNVTYDNLPIQDILKTATLTVNVAPMLAVLFLGCRMRVTWFTQGKATPRISPARRRHGWPERCARAAARPRAARRAEITPL